MTWEVRHGDALTLLRGMGSDSVDACVTDPPYGLEFMGRGWDHGVPGEDYWREAIDREAEYVELARKRIAGPLFAHEATP